MFADSLTRFLESLPSWIHSKLLFKPCCVNGSRGLKLYLSYEEMCREMLVVLDEILQQLGIKKSSLG